jgi:hypothetical protein
MSLPTEHEIEAEDPCVTSSKKLKYAVASEKIKGAISGTNNPDSQKCDLENIQCENRIGDCKMAPIPCRREKEIQSLK